MILYLDASAAVKRYVAEPGSTDVRQAIAAATVVGMVVIGRVEIVAALAKAVRMQAVTEALVARADSLAWQHGLQGYDAVHLAATLLWQDGLEESVTLATFDRQLWQAGRQNGLAMFPVDLT